MDQNTRQTNPIKELQTCGDEHAIHNKFRLIKSSQVKNRLIEVEIGTQLTQPQLSS